MEKFKSFKIEDNNVLVKYNEIWNKIKKVISIKFHSTPIYDKKCIKTKVKTFNGVASTTFWDDEIPKRNVHYTCIALINIDSVMKMDKQNCHQVYLEECKYKIKKIQMLNWIKFIDAELDLDDPDDSDDSVNFNYKKLHQF